MKFLVWGLVLLLVILHQDVWNWDNTDLVFGFIPFTLAYHAAISISASIVWFLATVLIWPTDLEEEVAMELEAQNSDPQGEKA